MEFCVSEGADRAAPLHSNQIVSPGGQASLNSGEYGADQCRRANEHARADEPSLDAHFRLFAQPHLCPRQYRSQRSAHPPAIMAQLRSPPIGDVHHAAVRDPPPEPSERQRITGPVTST